MNFLTQYEQAGGDKPMIGGSITVDQTVLNYKGKRRESLLGTASAGPMADSIDTPEWKKFSEEAAFNTTFMSGKQYADWVQNAETVHHGLMQEAGFIAK